LHLVEDGAGGCGGVGGGDDGTADDEVVGSGGDGGYGSDGALLVDVDRARGTDAGGDDKEGFGDLRADELGFAAGGDDPVASPLVRLYRAP
jgi:hypothetical protein